MYLSEQMLAEHGQAPLDYSRHMNHCLHVEQDNPETFRELPNDDDCHQVVLELVYWIYCPQTWLTFFKA